MLAGGRPNSLGRTEEAAAAVLEAPGRLDALLDAYASPDPLVRLRLSNALKRVAAERPDLMAARMERLILEVGAVDQASARWTLAQLFGRLAERMTPDRRARAEALMRVVLEEDDDWIVLTQTMATLAGWAAADAGLRAWLRPHLDRLATDPRRSVAGRAAKLRAAPG